MLFLVALLIGYKYDQHQRMTVSTLMDSYAESMRLRRITKKKIKESIINSVGHAIADLTTFLGKVVDEIQKKDLQQVIDSLNILCGNEKREDYTNNNEKEVSSTEGAAVAFVALPWDLRFWVDPLVGLTTKKDPLVGKTLI